MADLDTTVTFTAAANQSSDALINDGVAAATDIDAVSEVQVTATMRVFVAPDIVEVASVTFTATGSITSSGASLDLTGNTADFTATGTATLTVDAEIAPGPTTDDAGFATPAAAGSFAVDEPDIVGTGTPRDVLVEVITFTANSLFWAVPSLRRDQKIRQFVTAPDAEIRAALLGSVISVWRAVDILNADESLYKPMVGIISGSVSVDMTRDERRMIDLELDNFNRELTPTPDEFWYDKIIRARRGVMINGIQYEFDLGYFHIDRLEPTAHRRSVKLAGRDYTKKMIKSKFGVAVSFPAISRPEDVIKALALNSGVTRVAVSGTGQTIGQEDVSFDGDVSRWEAAKKLAEAANHDLFFDRDGTLRMLPKVDPVTTATVETFGDSSGNTISMEPSTNDDELYNHIVVLQENATSGELPIWAEAENNEPGSPTRISRIGRRTKRITSSLIDTQAKADALAASYLRIAALEQYDLSFEALNYPWLDVGKILKIDDSEAALTDPDRYLLSTLEIPMQVGPMSGTAKRVTVVG